MGRSGEGGRDSEGEGHGKERSWTVPPPFLPNRERCVVVDDVGARLLGSGDGHGGERPREQGRQAAREAAGERRGVAEGAGLGRRESGSGTDLQQGREGAAREAPRRSASRRRGRSWRRGQDRPAALRRPETRSRPPAVSRGQLRPGSAYGGGRLCGGDSGVNARGMVGRDMHVAWRDATLEWPPRNACEPL